jgi:transcriptional regulator with XRE-family HTH domain
MEGNEIGNRVRQLREAKGETQLEMAKKLGVLRETVVHWETGTRDLKTEYTVMLANHFGVTCDYLLRGIAAENVSIYEKTGLSQDAIDNIAFSIAPVGFNGITGRIGDAFPNPEHVNAFLADDGLLPLFNYISLYLEHSKNPSTVSVGDFMLLNAKAKQIGCTLLPPGQQAEFLRFAASTIFTSILKSMTDTDKHQE